MNKIAGLLIVALLSFFSVNTTAQDLEHRHAVSLNTGFSLSQLIFNSDWSNFASENTWTSFDYPAIQLHYDYRTNEWFSFGAGASWQYYGLDVDNELLFDDQGNVDSVTYTIGISKTNFAIRPLLHWKLKNPWMDLYSGIRLGVTLYSFDNGTDEDVSIGPEDMESIYYRERFAFSPQFIPLGFRGFFTENIGMGVEFAIGSPHFFNIGFIGRF